MDEKQLLLVECKLGTFATYPAMEGQVVMYLCKEWMSLWHCILVHALAVFSCLFGELTNVGQDFFQCLVSFKVFSRHFSIVDWDVFGPYPLLLCSS